MTSNLDLREKRDAFEQAAARETGLTIVTIRPNYPGPEKRNLHSNYVSYMMLTTLEKQLDVRTIRHSHDAEGLTFYLAVTQDGDTAKRISLEAEQDHPLGRLADIDVRTTSRSWSRRELGLPGRACFICQEDAMICTRMATHPHQEVAAFFTRTVDAWLTGGPLPDCIQRMAAFALLSELCRETGYGCVTANSVGSHQDMGFLTFIRSIQTVSEGLGSAVLEPETDFHALRQYGLTLEQAMFRATAGINTHKGAIFIYLLILGGLLHSKAFEDMKEQIARLSAPVLEDLKRADPSHGLRIYRNFGITGIRGEAVAGFPALFDVYVRTYDESRDMDRLSLTVMASADDTNVIHRAGLENLRVLQMKAREVLDGKLRTSDLDAWCLNRNISTGGSADQIGATIFAWLIRAHFDRLKGGTA